MTKILVATEKPFAKAAVDGIKDIASKAGFEVALLEKYTEKKELLTAVADADAMIVRSDIVDEEVFNAAKNLKIVVRAGAGYDSIDLNAATKHGVCVMNTPGQNANAVAELVFGLLFYTVRNRFNGKSGSELRGKRLGLLAYGNTSRNVARIGKGVGMEISACDPYSKEEVLKNEGIIPVKSKEELFKNNDIISMHIPATPETKGSINYDLIMSMPKGAILVNTARKEIMCEEGVFKALSERTDLYYVTDIKPDNDEQMREAFADRYFSTPKKMGAQTAEANINAGLAAAHQIVEFIKDGVERYRVNK